MTVTLPNGTVQERPLCNTRVTICEVDASFPSIIARLPGDLVYRLRDEWLAAIRTPGIGPDPSPEFQVARAGLHFALREPVTTALKPARDLLTLERATAVHEIRDTLIRHVELLRPYWCSFEWLREFYNVDCLRTVDVDDNGYFDTEITYPCYGDQPDLYFRIEQGCHPAGWLTVYAPSVHCNTYWNYCCGTPVTIKVTHPAAVPGRAPALCVWPYITGDPASVGSWELLPHTSGVFVVHAAVLHTSKVLLYSGTAEVGLPLESRVWDPDTGLMTAQIYVADIFCSGHAFLSDGRLLVNGGAGTAARRTYIFDPVMEMWTRVGDMNHGTLFARSIKTS
jgi:hypothetical protein